MLHNCTVTIHPPKPIISIHFLQRGLWQPVAAAAIYHNGWHFHSPDFSLVRRGGRSPVHLLMGIMTGLLIYPSIHLSIGSHNRPIIDGPVYVYDRTSLQSSTQTAIDPSFTCGNIRLYILSIHAGIVIACFKTGTICQYSRGRIQKKHFLKMRTSLR